jgi:hypothetical protein
MSIIVRSVDSAALHRAVANVRAATTEPIDIVVTRLGRPPEHLG